MPLPTRSGSQPTASDNEANEDEGGSFSNSDEDAEDSVNPATEGDADTEERSAGPAGTKRKAKASVGNTGMKKRVTKSIGNGPGKRCRV